MATINISIRKIIIGIIKCYQYVVSQMMGRHCRFSPSCSHYSCQAIQRFGVIHGITLSVRRLLRCHPWHDGGYDPIPEKVGTEH